MKRDAAGMWYRPEAMDRFIIDECNAVYGPMPVQPGETALDLGAHMGASARVMLAKGAGHVIAVEPDPSNLEVLRRNLDGYPATVIPAAVGATPGEVRLFSRADRPFLSTTFADEPGRDTFYVPMVAFEDLLATHRPTIVKCDIEFGEYDLPELWSLPDFVRVLAMEVHVRPDLVLHRVIPTRDDLLKRRAAAAALIQSIEAQGFACIRRKDKQAVKPPEVHDDAGFGPMTKSIDAIWTR